MGQKHGQIVICGYVYHLFIYVSLLNCFPWIMNKGNNKITELRTILQRESQNS
jgi:hypothetical protein